MTSHLPTELLHKLGVALLHLLCKLLARLVENISSIHSKRMHYFYNSNLQQAGHVRWGTSWPCWGPGHATLTSHHLAHPEGEDNIKNN